MDSKKISDGTKSVECRRITFFPLLNNGNQLHLRFLLGMQSAALIPPCLEIKHPPLPQ